MRESVSYTVSRNTAVSNAAVWLGVAAAVVVLAVPWLPYFGTSGFMRWAVEVMCYLVLAQMWNLMAGYGGLMSVGIQAFVGIGGYSMIVFAQHLGVNPFLSIPIAGLMAAVAATITSVLVFRMRGGYFAIGTWVLAEVFRIAFSNVSVLGGGSGQSLTVMARIDRSTRETMIYLIAAATLILASLAINLLLRSRFGLGLTALRDSESAAESQGVDVRWLKLQVYALSSFGAGLVGGIYYTNILRVSPTAAFDPNWVVAAIFIVVIGGIGTLEGPIVGAAIFFALRWALADYGTWYWLVMGAVAVLVIMFAPAGVWGYVRTRWNIQLLPLQRRLVITAPRKFVEPGTSSATLETTAARPEDAGGPHALGHPSDRRRSAPLRMEKTEERQ
jgi:branched-chain amino acid transport system permease protein